jgi:hypothetical protein
MSAKQTRLSDRSAAILKLISEGHTYEQIVSRLPRVTYKDIFGAALEALHICEGASDTRSQRISPIRPAHPDAASDGWTQDDDRELVKLYRKGVDDQTIITLLKRSPDAIRKRLLKLGLTEAERNS